MERPIARVIDAQHVESEREITGWEAEQLMRKYGHQPEQFSTFPTEQPQIEQPGLTFDEMVRQAEEKEINDRLRREQQMNGPRPSTFDGRNGYDSEIKYASDDDSGFGFKIEITSDMKLPRY
jgi:hypothetical protein